MYKTSNLNEKQIAKVRKFLRQKIEFEMFELLDQYSPFINQQELEIIVRRACLRHSEYVAENIVQQPDGSLKSLLDDKRIDGLELFNTIESIEKE